MLFDVIRSLAYGYHVDVWQIVAQVVSIVFVILCILPLHEFAHGWVANKLGDPTAKLAGRLTLNPLASVDPVGTVALILFGFGWAKPVPVDSRYFKKPRRDVALTALAGPVSNLLAALVGAFCHFALGFSLLESFLVGAVISSTDAASVFFILRSKKLGLKYHTASLLEVESGSNDPCSYMLTTIVLSSAVLYEIAGPGLAKLSLHLAGALEPSRAPNGEPLAQKMRA